ncbi:ABC transporter substrate-binding protein [Pseudoclavibacter endophyticus]|uniref:Putative aliphatic sulfonates-binding protein n=1 Tax=Pseudoclavibacter endophyticus TaxID=1778590 RepID=A0A6H9WNV1_9MICO|nr:aliphatic sulfonate ABC transporter substrate-binding protein [Pseudoclavibacter endophyticus]KAB1646769.1 aliphatic sulfonate ABC transporter substrate-binding protein [Pseudoclavibacter endophyticus]GGA75705.1 ABC transporter substrate-binding protein [Pseudoclavibacter endophyticus]
MTRHPIRLGAAIAAAAALALTGCAAGDAGAGAPETLNIDYATYSVLSLVIKDQGWLEEALAEEGVGVNWVLSAGSNKANENLRAEAIDFGTTGGGPALQARANGADISTVYVTHASEGFGLAVAADSSITSIDDLRGASIAVTRGTDPYFYLLQALEEAGIGADEVTLENLQHADGRAALDTGQVDAWSGLDPILAGAELAGAQLIHTDPSLISPIVLNVNNSFASQHPELTQLVIDTYERARTWVLENPDEALGIYADGAGLEDDVAELAFGRFNHDISGVPNSDDLSPVLLTIGGFMVESGDVRSEDELNDALGTLFDPSFAEAAASGASTE